MLAQTIQRQVPIGEHVKFLLTDGRDVSGRLVELSQDHVTLDSSGKRTTVLIGMVGGWEVLQDTVPFASDAPVSKTVIAEQENGAAGKPGIPSDRNLEEALRSTLEIDEDFEVIKNPYAEHAAGGPVQDPRMFFGRDDLITNVANSILSSRSQSKCVVIYGQYRTGKSSILYHLKTRLQEDRNLLVLDIGNIGAMLDPHSDHSLLYQILWTILQELQDTIEDRVNDRMPPLDITFPSDLDFYQHPTPLGMFSQIFQDFQRISSRTTEWKEISIVLLIDEFSYLHELIEAGNLPDSFMKNWKALLQRNFFNAVLVGQDVMPKFKQRYPNEFGTTQDERVTYLRQHDAKRLIDEPVRLENPHGDSRSRYRGKAIDRILDLTYGSPFYIQILCNRLVDYMNRERSILVTEADIEQVKNEMIRGENALGPDKFNNLINSGDTSADAITKDDALAVLREIARHSNNSSNSCSQDSISGETASPVHQVLDDLEKREVIKRQRANYYSIQVGLFKEWLLVHQ